MASCYHRGVVLREVEDTRCADCGGSGWLQVDGPGDCVRSCSCRQRRSVASSLQEAEIPPRYENCRLDTFQTAEGSTAGREQQVAAKRKSQLYVDDFYRLEETSVPDTGLVFLGHPGCGKTHLAVGVLCELISRHGLRGRFVDFTELTRRLQSALDQGSMESPSEVLSGLEDVEVLVLDELGSQKLNSWTEDILYNLVNGRYQRRQPTLFTTNYPLATRHQDEPAEWGASSEPGSDRWMALDLRVPRRLVSRLYEMARPIEMWDVSDFRRDVRAGQHHI